MSFFFARPASCLLAGMVVLISGTGLAPGTVLAEETVAPPVKAAPEKSPAVDMETLWADMPEYVAWLRAGRKMQKPPRLISAQQPAPANHLPPGHAEKIDVAVAINERGEVEAARILRSNDPRCDELALAAVRGWRFSPAEDASGRPIKIVAVMPFEFKAPDANESVTLGVGSPVRDMHGKSMSIPIALNGARAGDVKGARVTMKSVIDDTGTELVEDTRAPFGFFQPSVGQVSDAVLTAVSPPRLWLSFKAPEASAKTLKVVEALIELAIPMGDPDATVNLDRLPSRIGSPIRHPALDAAQVRLHVLDKARCDQIVANASDTSGLRDYLAPTPAFPGLPAVNPAKGMTDKDVVLIIEDPQGKVVGHEFQTHFGKPVRYNHNGWSHFEIRQGKRLVIYRLPAGLTDEIKLVCWLATPKSVAQTPLKVADFPLPPSR